MPDSWYQSASERSCYTMLIKIRLTLLDFFFVKQTEVSELTVGKLIYYRSSYIERSKVIDRCSDVCPDSGEQHHKHYVQISTRSIVSRRSHNQF